MRSHRPRRELALLVMILVLVPRAVQGQDAAPAKKDVTDEKAIRALISQLGDESFEKRQDADKKLAALGRPALRLLREAVKESADAEVRERAERLIQKINKGPGPEVAAQRKAIEISPNGPAAVETGELWILIKKRLSELAKLSEPDNLKREKVHA